MSACASLAANVPAVSGASPIQAPILLVHGILEPAIVVEQYDVTGPDDRRGASLTVAPEAMAQNPGLLDRLLDADGAVNLGHHCRRDMEETDAPEKERRQ